MTQRPKNLILPGIMGNILEWYDFSLYAYLAPTIANLFFPSRNQASSLLATFGVFAMGFLLRPFSSIIFGHLGDRIGRKITLLISSGLLAMSTFFIGLLPTYASIGVIAAILLTLCRLMQGLALGGEVGFSVYIVEHAPANQRGLYGSVPVFSCIAGFLFSSFTVMSLEKLLTQEQLINWGWRLPFLIGILLGGITLYFRLYMPETPYFLKIKTNKQIAKKPFQHTLFFEWKTMIKGGGLSLLAFITFGVLFIYLPSYLHVYMHVSFENALLANTLSIIVMLITTPLVAFFSDKIGRKPIFLFASLGFVIFSYPLFSLLSSQSFIILLLVQIIFAIFVCFSYAPLMVTLVELFPTPIRYTAIAFPFNVVGALFGGTSPLIAAFLITLTHNKMAPSFYLIFAGMLTLLLLPFISESYKQPLK